MNNIWNIAEIIEVCNAKTLSNSANKNVKIYDIQIDSRKVKKGDLFVALKGEYTDGHKFIEKAFELGANAVLAEQNSIAKSYDGEVIIVKNCLEALTQMAKFKRHKTNAKVIAVTGSVGKTTTKEMLHSCLQHYGKTFSTKGNFNNELGLPITMCRIPNNAEFVVLELGMSNSGEIAKLSKLCKPNIAMITAIAPAHMENFNSLEEIALAKAEIFFGIEPNTNNKHDAIINKDAKCFDTLFSQAEKSNLRVATYCVNNINNHAHLNNYPEHVKSNMAGVIKVVEALNLNTSKAEEQLANFAAVKGRGESFNISINNKQIKVIDESYNANPLSMKATLSACKKLSTKKLAILGDMLELGEQEKEYHTKLLPSIIEGGFSGVICIGNIIKALHIKAENSINSKYFTKVDDFLPNLLEHITSYDVLLVKGSNSIGLDKIIQELKTHAI